MYSVLHVTSFYGKFKFVSKDWGKAGLEIPVPVRIKQIFQSFGLAKKRHKISDFWQEGARKKKVK